MTGMRMTAVLAVLAFWAVAAEPAPRPAPAADPAAEKPAPVIPKDGPPRQPEPTKDWPELVRSNNGFAWGLYAELAKKDGNLFFSPSSIHTALGMTYAGAGGNTASEMRDVLRLPHDALLGYPAPGSGGEPVIIKAFPWPQGRVHRAYAGLLAELKPGERAGYQLHVANALWGQKGYPWLEDFLTTTRANYGAGLREVDFVKETEAARQTINEWVEKQTKDKIKELLKEGILTPQTCLVLANAIYFKGDWASPFKTDRTRDEPFTVSAEKKLNVPMMHQTAEFDYAASDDFQVLRMPYVGGELHMEIVLPRKADGLAALEKSVAKDRLAAVLAALRFGKQKVVVAIPKFKMTSEFSLNDTLSEMGMKDAFTPLAGPGEGAADFSGMDGRKDLFITAVIHKAFVDVNEEGTEAAAATAVVMEGLTSVPPRPPVFRADHPFLFLIRHEKTGAILFLGRVRNPKG